MSSFCRIYAILLYAYPRDFRRAYGRDMQQVFRDRCREAASTSGRRPILRFAAHVAHDLLTSTVRERAASMWSAARKSPRRGFISEWAVTILMYLFAATTLVQAYVVPTGSMEGTIRIGDHMLVDRVSYANPGSIGRHILPYREIRRGDLVVFRYPEDVRQTYVKRVIGLPGDRVVIGDGKVSINGQTLTEPYIAAAPLYSGNWNVPDGYLFVLGDNRNDSSDSHAWGFLPIQNVIGKALLIYWPPPEWAMVDHVKIEVPSP